MARPILAPLVLLLLHLALGAPQAGAQVADAAPTAGREAAGPAPAPAPGAPVRLEAGARASASAPPEPRTLRDWYAMGGWVMHLLAALSVLTLGLVLERAGALRPAAVLPRRLSAALCEARAAGRLEEMRALCRDSSSALARIVAAGLAAGRDPSARLEAVRSAGEAESWRLQRNLGLLAAMGNLATMLGLLGTVLGMIEAFEVIARVGTGDARVVASGIFRALVTTAGGLGVGIAALGAHSLLRRRIESVTLRLEEVVAELFGADAQERAESCRRTGASADAVLAS